VASILWIATMSPLREEKEFHMNRHSYGMTSRNALLIFA